MNTSTYLPNVVTAALFFMAVVWTGTVFLSAGWRVYVKAGRPGWASLVPVYHLVVLSDICYGKKWKTVLFFIPVFGIIFWIRSQFVLAGKFGRTAEFGFGLCFLYPVFICILGLSHSIRYTGMLPEDTEVIMDPEINGWLMRKIRYYFE